MTFWIGAPLSKWRSYEVRLWAKNAPLRCIIVSKNAPKFLIKPEAPCSKSLHKPLVSWDQGALWVFHLSKQGRGSYFWKFEGNVFPFRLQALCLFSPPSFQISDLQGLFLSRVRNLEYLEHISNWLSNFWQQSIPLGSAVCRSRAVTTKKWWRQTKVFNKIVNYLTTQEVGTTNWRFLEHI